jgi:hypothetical protein
MPACSLNRRRTTTARNGTSSSGDTSTPVALGRAPKSRPTGDPTAIDLVAGDRRAHARSVLAIMGLGALKDSEVRIIVTGPDADAVADGVVEILRSSGRDEWWRQMELGRVRYGQTASVNTGLVI